MILPHKLMYVSLVHTEDKITQVCVHRRIDFNKKINKFKQNSTPLKVIL
jgi:hypothetical protein